jgi:threonine synthase
LKLPRSTGSGQAAGERGNVEFVVPTGNFGNVLAGWMLQKMGVPIRGFRVATNQNDILYRLFTTGEYRVGEVHPSLAPSMDIQVASNFERFIYFAVGRDPAKVREVMETFKRTGAYKFENFNRDTFSASRTSDAEIASIIARVYRDYGYVADPHTACGFKDIGEGAGGGVNSDRVRIVLATASPAKFPETIQAAIGQAPTHPSLEALKTNPIVKHRLKATPDAIRAFIEARAVG